MSPNSPTNYFLLLKCVIILVYCCGNPMISVFCLHLYLLQQLLITMWLKFAYTWILSLGRAIYIYMYIWYISPSLVMPRPMPVIPDSVCMYAVLIQQLINLRSCLWNWLGCERWTKHTNQRELRLQRRWDWDRVRCQSQPQLNSRAVQSVQEQRQLSLQRRRDGLIADSVESRLLEMSARQHERLAIESAEERERPAYEHASCSL